MPVNYSGWESRNSLPCRKIPDLPLDAYVTLTKLNIPYTLEITGVDNKSTYPQGLFLSCSRLQNWSYIFSLFSRCEVMSLTPFDPGWPCGLALDISRGCKCAWALRAVLLLIFEPSDCRVNKSGLLAEWPETRGQVFCAAPDKSRAITGDVSEIILDHPD